MKKRILASLLSLVMVLSMFQTALAAEGFTPADEPQQDEAVCICDALCTEEMVNTDCPVCGGEAGYPHSIIDDNRRKQIEAEYLSVLLLHYDPNRLPKGETLEQ